MKNILKLDEMSSEEIKLKMIDLENEHETLKNDVGEIIDKMDNLNELYIKAKEELKKRKII